MEYRDKSFYNLQLEKRVKNIILRLVFCWARIWEREKNLDADTDPKHFMGCVYKRWDVPMSLSMASLHIFLTTRQDSLQESAFTHSKKSKYQRKILFFLGFTHIH
jgi:hypothetical protein